MSNDQIIRSSKPHEVTIPEGSNNARSIRNKVGQREIEQEHEEKVSVDKQYTDRTLTAESEALSDSHAAVESGGATDADRVALVQEDASTSERVQVVEADSAADNRVQVQSTAGAGSNTVKLPGSDQEGSRVALPSEDGPAENRVAIPVDARDDNRVVVPTDSRADQRAMVPTDDPGERNQARLDTEVSSDSRVAIDTSTQTSHRVTLPEDDFNSHSSANEGSTSSQPVSIPSDSIHDSFASTPDMTHTDSSPVQVDGHGITDPDRVIVENTPDQLAEVLVPHAQPEVTTTPLVADQAPSAVAEAVATAPVAPQVRATPAQVTGHLADKKAEEFRGRVVKLRDEVDQLNRRLDEFKK